MSQGIEVIPWNFAMVYVQISTVVSTSVLRDVIPAGSGKLSWFLSDSQIELRNLHNIGINILSH